MNKYSFNQQAADSENIGNNIMVGGVYTGMIVRALIRTSASGVESFILDEVEVDNGGTIKYARMMTFGTTEKGNKPMPGFNKLQAFMGMNGIQDLTTQPYVDNGFTSQETVNLRGIKVRFSVQRVERVYQGKIKFDLEILHFFDINSGCTYTEMREGKPAATITREIVDSLVDPKTVGSSGFTGAGNTAGGFGSSTGSSFGGKPFGGSFSGGFSSTQQGTAQQNAAADDNRNQQAMNNLNNNAVNQQQGQAMMQAEGNLPWNNQ